MTIFIIGLGLIGGSVGIDLSRQLGVHTIGYDADPQHLQTAIDRRLVHRSASIDAGLELADIILLATPVTVMEDLLPGLLDRLRQDQILIDLGSTKGHLVQAVKGHPMRRRYVAAHPLAGTEHSGPAAAVHGLFAGKRNILCDIEDSDTEAVKLAIAVFDSIGMTTSVMDSQAHDQHLAYVSHLSHVTSFALGLTVLDLEEDTDTIMRLAGTGFASTARLAKSNPTTWQAIFTKNAVPLTHAIDEYLAHLTTIRAAIATQDTDKMYALMTTANKLKPYI